MEKKRQAPGTVILAAVKTGAGGAALSFLLLLPAAALLYKGVVPLSAVVPLAACAAGIAALLSHFLFPAGQGSGILPAAAGPECVCLLLLILLAAGVPGCRLFGSAFPAILGASVAGNITGSILRSGAKARKAARRHRVYNR